MALTIIPVRAGYIWELFTITGQRIVSAKTYGTPDNAYRAAQRIMAAMAD